MPRIIRFLSEKARPTHRRAAAFTLCRAIVPIRTSPLQKIASEVVLNQFHLALQVSYGEDEELISLGDKFQARSIIDSLASLVANSEPLPELISRLLSPVIQDLYMLSFDINQVKTVDPQLKDIVHGLLLSWGK